MTKFWFQNEILALRINYDVKIGLYINFNIKFKSDGKILTSKRNFDVKIKIKIKF